MIPHEGRKKRWGDRYDGTPAATMNDDERDKRDKRDKRDTREGLGLEEEVGFLLTATARRHLNLSER